MSEFSVLLVGQPQNGACAEMCDAARIPQNWSTARDPRVAAEFLAVTAAIPELIVVAQSRPGEFTEASLDALRALAPLARVWRVLGSWCEGEARSGRPPRGCVSNYWHQWPARWVQEMSRAGQGLCPAWALPPTATADERALAVNSRPLPRGHGTIALRVRESQARAALADVCRLGGYEPWTLDGNATAPQTPVTATLWDAMPADLEDPAVIDRIRVQTAGAPILALVGFPRPDDVRRAADLGLAGLVSKPYLLADLLWQIRQVSSRAAA